MLFLVLDTEDTTPERTREIDRLYREAMEVVHEQGWGAFSSTAYAALPEYDAGAISPSQSRYFVGVIAATTGGVQLPYNGRSLDQVALITVDGSDLCFEKTVCGPQEPEAKK